MDGVTILQVIEKTYLNDISEGFLVGAVMVGLMAVILFICFTCESGFNGWSIAMIVLFIGCVGIALVAVTGSKVTEITYRVLVDSNVNMNEFFSKYELIRTEGLIYVVKEIANGI